VTRAAVREALALATDSFGLRHVLQSRSSGVLELEAGALEPLSDAPMKGRSA
jgi:hypothetical protein